MRRIGGSALVAAIAGLAFLAAAPSGAAAQGGAPDSPFLRVSPERILITDASGNKPCGECHQSELAVWKGTKHSSGFDTMHKKESARDILTAMGFRVTKRQEAICMRCHYTVGPDRTAVAGVSCESCHGAARDWINVHNKLSGGAKDGASETPANREARLGAARTAGMLSPSVDLYGVAANCFECHTVPVERLVNEGGHTAGTRSFDLVAGVGKIRHNFLGATGAAATNHAITPEHRRVLFVVGRLLAYEYALRGYALATRDSTYSTAMERRVKAAFTQLQEVNTVSHSTAIDEVLAAGRKAKLVPNNRAEVIAAAEQIRAIGQRFANSVNGTTLAALDPAITGEPAPAASAVASAPASGVAPAATKTTVPAPSAPNATARGTGSAATGAGAVAPPPTPAGAAPQPQTAAAPAAARSTGATMPGSVKSRPDWIQTAGRTGYADAGDCAGCHRQASAWWSRDKHSDTGARRLLGEDAKARRIADAYGIGADGMRRPTSICMSCHATVDESRRAAAPIENGVSCESCHGAGGRFLEPHQNGGNPQAGMRALKQAADRAQTCAGCHRMTDERLLAAGHPSGAEYDFARSVEKIKHWPEPKADRAREKRGGGAYVALDAGALRSAYAAVATARPIPKVDVVVAPAGAAASPNATATAASAGAAGTASPGAAATPSPVPAAQVATAQRATAAAPAEAPEVVPRTSPARRNVAPVAPSRSSAASSSGPLNVNIEPMPPTDKLTIEELLLLVKQRVANIHGAARRN